MTAVRPPPPGPADEAAAAQFLAAVGRDLAAWRTGTRAAIRPFDTMSPSARGLVIGRVGRGPITLAIGAGARPVRAASTAVPGLWRVRSAEGREHLEAGDLPWSLHEAARTHLRPWRADAPPLAWTEGLPAPVLDFLTAPDLGGALGLEGLTDVVDRTLGDALLSLARESEPRLAARSTGWTGLWRARTWEADGARRDLLLRTEVPAAVRWSPAQVAEGAQALLG